MMGVGSGSGHFLGHKKNRRAAGPRAWGVSVSPAGAAVAGKPKCTRSCLAALAARDLPDLVLAWWLGLVPGRTG